MEKHPSNDAVNPVNLMVIPYNLKIYENLGEDVYLEAMNLVKRFPPARGAKMSSIHGRG